MLTKVGRELMARYEAITIGDMMAAKEPVLALRRVEIQNLLQDYGDKIIEQKVQPYQVNGSADQRRLSLDDRALLSSAAAYAVVHRLGFLLCP